jgi:hypothetical protein
MTKPTGEDEEVAQRRDEVLRRMIATPPKPHKAMKRRPAKASEGRQLEKRRTNKKRDKA